MRIIEVKKLLATSCLSCLAFCLALPTQSIGAQDTLNWTNTTGTSNPWFEVASNWDPAQTPEADDSVFFDNPGTNYEVWWDGFVGDRTVESLSVFQGETTFLNQPNDTTRYKLTVLDTFNMFGGPLTIRGIEVDCDSANILGEFNVDGSAMAGSSVNVNGDMALLSLDTDGMNITNGGQVTTGGIARVADSLLPDEPARVNIDGLGSEWNIDGELRIGVSGEGTVNVTDGAILRSNGTVMGDASDFSLLDVVGVGSQWINTGSFNMEKGTLRISDFADVVVDGPIESMEGNVIFMDDGTLNAPAGITNNGTITASFSVINSDIENNNLIEYLGDLTINGNCTNSPTNLNSGVYGFEDQDITIRFEGSYNGGGTGNSSQPSQAILAHEYHPGNDGPAVTIFQDMDLEMEATNTTFIELGGVNDGEFDRIQMSPNSILRLGGELQVDLIDGFTLEADQSFEIIEFGSFSNSFTFANFAEGDVVLSNNGFDLVISYGSGGVNLNTVANSTPPDNDNFADTNNAGDFPFTLNGTNVGATVEMAAGEQQLDNTGATVWWFFEAPSDGTVSINTFGSDFDTQLHIFDGFFNGAGPGDLNPVVNSDDFDDVLQSTVTFQVTAGACYEIRVGGFVGVGDSLAQGNIVLNGTFVSNDNFANAIETEDFPFTLNGTNVDATVELAAGELQIDSTGATVWRFFRAPSDGMVTIDTFGSDFDTQLHIFDGFFSDLGPGDLNPVVNNDDAGGTLQSQVTFAVTAGDVYEIRVGGFDSDGGGDGAPAAQGNIVLNGTFEPADVLLGDVNCDGAVNLLDVEPFVNAISGSDFDPKADINQDNAVNLLDVEPFVSLLSGS